VTTKTSAAPVAVRVCVDVDPTLAVGMTSAQVGLLVWGIGCVRVEGGVRVHLGRHLTPVFSQPHVAALRLHALADEWAAWSTDCGGLSTATGRWWRDRAELLRVVGEQWLWTGEDSTALLAKSDQ
jgi:hypothetical protein